MNNSILNAQKTFNPPSDVSQILNIPSPNSFKHPTTITPTTAKKPAKLRKSKNLTVELEANEIKRLSKLIEIDVISKIGATKKMERVRDKWENKKKEEELEKLRKKEVEMKKNYFEYLKYCEENKNNTKNNPPLESQDPTQKSQIDLDKIINQASIIPKANANMKFFQNTKIKTYMTQLDQKYDFQKMPLIYSQNSKKPKRNPKRKCLNLNPLPRAHPTASSRSKTRYNPHLSINPSSPNPPSFTPTQSFSTPNSPHLLSKFQNPSARASLQPCLQNPHLHSQLDHDHGQEAHSHDQEEELNVDLTELERAKHIGVGISDWNRRAEEGKGNLG